MLDENAFDELLADEPDEALGLLADLTGATDTALRDLARRVAGQLFLDVGRVPGSIRPRGIGRIVEQPYRPDGGDLDIDASLDALAAVAAGRAVDPERLRVRGWVRPGTAWCLLVDRSGSMGGGPLAAAAVAAAAVASRGADDYSVLAFGRDVVVAKSQDGAKPAERVVTDVLSLRGFGTTDLAGALRVAAEQLARSRAGRKIAVLLSDCRATVSGDPVRAAAALDELVVVAPATDADEARRFVEATGCRLATVGGPSEVAAAIMRAVDR